MQPSYLIVLRDGCIWILFCFGDVVVVFFFNLVPANTRMDGIDPDFVKVRGKNCQRRESVVSRRVDAIIRK